MGPQQQTHCCRFADVHPSGRIYKHSWYSAAAGKCGQCLIVNVHRKLNPDLLAYTYTVLMIIFQ